MFNLREKVINHYVNSVVLVETFLYLHCNFTVILIHFVSKNYLYYIFNYNVETAWKYLRMNANI